MELREFIGSLIIAILFLLGVRMFSIVIPALKDAFERIKELNKQLQEEREKEQLEYKKILEDSTEPVFGKPTIVTKGFSQTGPRSRRIENTICLDDVCGDFEERTYKTK